MKNAQTIAEVSATIRAEGREDCYADIRSIRVAEAGNVATIDTPGGRVALEPGALRDLAGWCDAPHAAPFLQGVFSSPSRIAVARDTLDNLLRTAPARTVLVRSRSAALEGAMEGLRTAYAVRSEGYAVDMGALVALEAIEGVGRGLGAEVGAMYDAPTTRVTATYETAEVADAFGAAASVGDVLRAGARVTTDDRGGAALTTVDYVLRILCLNGMTGATGGKPSRLRHVAGRRGFDLRKFRRHVEKAIATARETGAAFARARSVDVFAAFGETHPDETVTPENVIGAVIARNPPTVPGVGRADVVAAVVSGWHRQPYTAAARVTLADVANAATYAAHATEWAGASRWTAQPALEAYGGALLRLTARTAV